MSSSNNNSKFTFIAPMVSIDTHHKWILYFPNLSNELYIIKSIEAHYSGGQCEMQFKRNGYLTIQNDFVDIETMKNSVTFKANTIEDSFISAERWDGIGQGLFFDNADKMNMDLSFPIFPGKNKINLHALLYPNANIVLGGYTDKDDSELSLIVHGYIIRSEDATIEE